MRSDPQAGGSFEHDGIAYDVSDDLLHLAGPLNDMYLEDVSTTADPLGRNGMQQLVTSHCLVRMARP